MTEKPRKQEQEEATTDITEMAPGVLRTMLPVDLPGLGHVNCYVLEDERGVAVVDPGLPGPDSWNALVDRLKRAGYEIGDVHTAVITHSHFDHFGGAERLREEAGADVLTHESFRPLWDRQEATETHDPEGNATEEEILERIEESFRRPTPWGTRRTPPRREQIRRFRGMGDFNARWFRTPTPTVTVVDSQIIRLARREWVALHTPGHTGDHLCLYDPAHGLVFSGDHVLPTITPHIAGRSDTQDSLAEFFDSLRRMNTLEGTTVALPAHGHPFTDVGARADDIRVHHHERLDVLRQAGARLGRATVEDYMRVLFSERAWGDMAASETFAHLVHLNVIGEAHQDVTPDGLVTFELQPAQSPPR